MQPKLFNHEIKSRLHRLVTGTAAVIAACGELPEISPITIGCDGYRVSNKYTVYPNPVKSNTLAAQPNETKEAKASSTEQKLPVRLYGFYTYRIARQWQVPDSKSVKSLNVAGVKRGKCILVIAKDQYKKAQQTVTG